MFRQSWETQSAAAHTQALHEAGLAQLYKLLNEEDLKIMSRLDFTPYRRSTVGFDRVFDLLESQARTNSGDNYPPFNITRSGEDNYRITLAVAGFRPQDIDITAQQNLLVVQGKKREETDEGGELIHVGIANRGFERRFELADFVRVENAGLADGLLTIDLVREVPEAMKPKKIAVNGTSTPTLTAVTDNTANEEDKAAGAA
ncbi:Hsp20 family protein [Erythrobacter sp. MTPC3]